MSITTLNLVQCFKKTVRENVRLMVNLHQRCMSSSTEKPEKTSLYDFHIENGGKMVNFAGYLLPVQYSDLGIAASHLHTRKNASVFDVSHMLQTYVKGTHKKSTKVNIAGKDCIDCFESICTADIKGLPNNSGTLTVFTNYQGNILDDLIVSRISSDLLYVVSNAAMKKQDMDIMKTAVDKYKSQGKDVHIEFLTPSDRALLAVQGPKAVSSIQEQTKVDLSQLYFMTTVVSEIAGIKDCRITRCGYTGEDGVEISVPADKAKNLAEILLSNSNVKLAGLGARDSLRLEAGLCLYGSDIDATTNPIEAGLAWLVAKRRRADANFPGANVINNHLKNGVQRRRIGIRTTSGPPARAGVTIYVDNAEIGVVTSGCPSPSLGGNIAMGYIKEDFKKPGTKINLKIRDKLHSAEIAKMPFIPSKYYMKPKDA